MSHYILFTSVGHSDPISKNREGAILQICRKYKPELIYMFLSQQINEIHIKDNRYCLSIEKLSKSIDGFNPKLELIVDPDLFHVHKFDIFYENFESRIKRIREEYPEHTILINISSGTPAMKNALNLIAALYDDNNIIAVQVDTPYTDYEYKPFDIDKEWDTNLDNDPKLNSNYSRVHEEKNQNLIARIKKEMIRKHLSAYDYHAAYFIAQDISGSIPPVCMKLLEAACCRIQLDEYGMQQALSGTGYDFTPWENKQKKNIIEYLLWLQIKQLRNDYADFIRGITPLVTDLFEIILKRHTDIYLPDYCKAAKRDGYVTYYVSRDKLLKSEKGKEILQIEDAYFKRTSGNNMKNGFYNSPYIYALIEYYIKDKPNLISKLKKVLYVERNVRNLAAHEIVSITDEWIVSRCRMSSKEIMDSLKYLAIEAGIVNSDDPWNSYDRMNQIIEETIIEDRK